MTRVGARESPKWSAWGASWYHFCYAKKIPSFWAFSSSLWVRVVVLKWHYFWLTFLKLAIFWSILTTSLATFYDSGELLPIKIIKCHVISSPIFWKVSWYLPKVMKILWKKEEIKGNDGKFDGKVRLLIEKWRLFMKMNCELSLFWRILWD